MRLSEILIIFLSKNFSFHFYFHDTQDGLSCRFQFKKLFLLKFDSTKKLFIWKFLQEKLGQSIKKAGGKNQSSFQLVSNSEALSFVSKSNFQIAKFLQKFNLKNFFLKTKSSPVDCLREKSKNHLKGLKI